MVSTGIFATLLLLSMSTSMFNIQPVKAEFTMLYVTPSMVYALLEESFIIDINVENVDRLHGWQVNMSFNPDVLRFVNVTEGDFLGKEGRETVGFSYLDNITDGWALFSWAILGQFSVNGSGTLASVEFEVLEKGESKLDLVTEPVWSDLAQIWINMTFLIRMNPPPEEPEDPPEVEEIPFTATDGYFDNQLHVWLYDQLMALNSSYYSLLDEHQELLSKYGELESDYTALNASYSSLLDNLSELHTAQNSLQSGYDSLNDGYNMLERDYDNLLNSYNLMETKLNSLNSTYDSLKVDYDDLESKYETITGAMETARNLNYVFIITTIAIVFSTAYFLLRKPK